MPLSLGAILPAIAALLGVLGLVLLAGRAARLTGYARPTTGRRLALQESLALDRARQLLLVRCDGRDILLLTGATSETVIGWLPTGKPTP